jgi:hypothetical protein
VSRKKPALKERRPTVNAINAAIDNSGTASAPRLTKTVEAACSADVAADVIAMRQLRDELEIERERMLDRARAHVLMSELREVLSRLHVRDDSPPFAILAASRKKREAMMGRAPAPRRLAALDRPVDAAVVDALAVALDAAAKAIPFESVTEQTVDIEIAERAVRVGVSTDDAGRALGKSASWLRKARATTRPKTGATGRPKK